MMLSIAIYGITYWYRIGIVLNHIPHCVEVHIISLPMYKGMYCIVTSLTTPSPKSSLVQHSQPCLQSFVSALGKGLALVKRSSSLRSLFPIPIVLDGDSGNGSVLTERARPKQN